MLVGRLLLGYANEGVLGSSEFLGRRYLMKGIFLQDQLLSLKNSISHLLKRWNIGPFLFVVQVVRTGSRFWLGMEKSLSGYSSYIVPQPTVVITWSLSIIAFEAPRHIGALFGSPLTKMSLVDLKTAMS